MSELVSLTPAGAKTGVIISYCTLACREGLRPDVSGVMGTQGARPPKMGMGALSRLEGTWKTMDMVC